MRYADLRWTFFNDSIQPHEIAQRLKPVGGKERVYIIRWKNNRHTVLTVSTYDLNKTGGWELEYERRLDKLDIAVRLTRMEEDKRVHTMFHIDEPHIK